jgi:putative acetyltransferase
MPEIRDERVQDAEAVDRLVTQAFGRQSETRLVARLRASGKIAFSMIAGEKDHLLGYALFSCIAIEHEGRDFPALALAPLAVLPAFQRLGIGSALLSAGLERCREGGHPRVLVQGAPLYYGRFGFVPASRFGVRGPFPEAGESFMALELQPAAFANLSGRARYGHEFDDLD